MVGYEAGAHVTFKTHRLGPAVQHKHGGYPTRKCSRCGATVERFLQDAITQSLLDNDGGCGRLAVASEQDRLTFKSANGLLDSG